MNNRVQSNPAYFLATLGVYLGLVLVGATPVFGHAATTRVFDVKDEIERKDDLDKNPDGESSFEDYADALIELYRITVDQSLEFTDEGLAVYGFDCGVSAKTRSSLFQSCPRDRYTLPNTLIRRFSSPLRKLHNAFIEPNGKWHENLRVKFDFGESAVSFRTTIIDDNSEIAAARVGNFEKSLQRHRSLEFDIVRSIIFRATTIELRDNLVGISTHLPRSDIEPMFAINAK